MNIRHTTTNDLEALQEVLNATGLFPSEMLAEMIAPFLTGSSDDALWLTCEDGGALGFCYAQAEALTEGTWNMLAIAVSPDQQGRGFGAALAQAMERALQQRDARILIVDTSGTEAFARTRAFYAHNGYTEEARIRDFWAEGDDKVIFRKAL